jgi:8-oxo-dGTP pyrophosphatase MutT (NUDIX family)
VTDEAIRAVVREYLETYPGEAERLRVFTDALAGGEDMTSRKTLPGHVTTGAFVLDGRGRLLQIAHKSLRRWLNPGGHTEPEDASLLEAALRELREETGIRPEAVVPIGVRRGGLPLAIDAHEIPANSAKGEPAHWHFDFRFAFRLVGDDTEAIAIQVEEVDGYRWVPLAEAQLGQDEARVAAAFAESKPVPQ